MATGDTNLTNLVLSGDLDVSGTITGDVTGEVSSLGSAETAEHGAGVAGAVTTYRYNMPNGDICTEIQVLLDGLKCKGDAAQDAIGLSTGAAYIGRYVTATCGVVYRVEMLCLATPTEETATITTDIDLDADDEDDIAYDGAVNGGTILNTGGVAVGESYVNDAPGLTANDYLYLTEGDTTASTGEYSGGQLIVRLYGHAALS